VKTYAIVPSFVVDPEVTPAVVVVITMAGAVVSCVYANWVAAVFPLPTASVNALPATSIVMDPSAEGVNKAVYTVELVVPRVPSVPPETVMSAFAKLVVASLEVNVSVTAALDAPPFAEPDDVIVMVGSVPSYVQV
jgi:hypothetical protein